MAVVLSLSVLFFTSTPLNVMRYHGVVWLLFAVVMAWSAQTTTAEEPHNAIGLEWLLQLYNPHRWGVSPPGELTIPCRNDIKSYLMALGNGSTWAAQSKFNNNLCLS